MKLSKYLIAVLICFCVFGVNIQASENTTFIIAGSDYQGDTVSHSSEHVQEILQVIKKDGHSQVDGTFFVGDYTTKLDNRVEDSNQGLASLRKTLLKEYPDIQKEKMIFSQGNHDPYNNLDVSKGGLHSFDTYHVYVIHEKDYMWQANRLDGTVYEKIAKETANQLKNVLQQKLEKGDKRPIFVLCHIPLHVSLRTSQYGDGEYGKYIFDVLNEAGKWGLNIIFLYGHNHSKGCENYLGGAAVYLSKGDDIYIPIVGTKTGNNKQTPIQYTKETLNFTYMNAGYTGYFTDAGKSDSCLTMTTFSIDEEKVEIRRYSKEGIHELKSRGEKANSFAKESNLTVYESGQFVALEDVKYKELLKLQEIVHPSIQAVSTFIKGMNINLKEIETS